jgi:hypothetical protein
VTNVRVVAADALMSVNSDAKVPFDVMNWLITMA